MNYFVVLLTAAALAAPPTFEHQEECGNPVMESMSWVIVKGKIASVGADGSLDLIRPPHKVHLVSVDAGGEAARKYLKSLVGKRAEVWVAMSAFDKYEVTGVVYVGKVEVNRALLASGVARYVQPAPYTVSDYTDCLYRIAARQATPLAGQK